MDIKCSGEMHSREDSKAYFDHFYHVLFKDEDFLRTFWAFLKWYPCPTKLTHHNFFESAYDQEMKSVQMPAEKQFISWLVQKDTTVTEELKLTDREMWTSFSQVFCPYANHNNYYTENAFKKRITPEALGLENHGYSKKRGRLLNAPRDGTGSLATFYTLEVPKLLQYFEIGSGDGDGDVDGPADGTAPDAGENTAVEYGPHLPVYICSANAFFAHLEAQDGAKQAVGIMPVGGGDEAADAAEAAKPRVDRSGGFSPGGASGMIDDGDSDTERDTKRKRVDTDDSDDDE